MVNVLITGGSGYLGGSLLAYLKQQPQALPPGTTIYSLVRSKEQADKTRQYHGVEPIIIDLEDEDAIARTFEEKDISIVAFLIDARRSEVQQRMIRALAKLQNKTGQQTHLIQTSGAKGFSSHANFPLDPAVSDEDQRLFEIGKGILTEHERKASGAGVISKVNSVIIEEAEANGVRAYVVAPCIVYGEGEGFGNRVSIQTVAVVKAALATKRMYRVDQGEPIWPVCHVRDQSSMYACLLHNIVSGANAGYNKGGYYLASPGAVAWRDIYAAMGKSLARRGLIDDDQVHQADESALKQMAKALDCDPSMVSLHMGGICTWIPKHARSIGWQPAHRPEHILEDADDEVELILKSLSG